MFNGTSLVAKNSVDFMPNCITSNFQRSARQILVRVPSLYLVTCRCWNDTALCANGGKNVPPVYTWKIICFGLLVARE